ncbi:MAG TPA: ABC transporter substrate-binding protein [Mycobacteriales bacterium]|nr:ABC transporter substrate-binding protein [Mycobacteriales bacterium]
MTTRGSLNRMMTRRSAMRALGGLGMGAAAATALPGCTFTKGEKSVESLGLSKKPASGRKVDIEIYSLWGSTIGQGFVDLAKQYEQIQDEVGVRVTYAPSTSQGQQKLFTAIAGNQAPDIAQLVPLQTPQWAALGIMTDLTDYFKADGLSGDDFLPPAWHDMVFEDKVWQLQWDADANFPFFWNKDLFEKSGLDPDKPPKTIDEMDEMSKKMTKKSGGRVTQIGIIPWNQYGMANSVYTWGWAFGGDFYDLKTGEVTCDNEYVVKALEWICKSAKDVGGADNVSVSPPGVTLHYFGTGNVGMSSLVTPNLADIKAAKPKMKIGNTLWPYQPPGGSKPGQAAWLGGWSAFVPKGSKHPKEAWDFMKWWAATDQGTAASYKGTGFPPAYTKSSALNAMKKDDIGKPYYDVMFATQHSRPAMEVADFYSAQIDEQASRALYGQMTPYQAMKKVKADTQKELERFNREVRS